MLNPSPKQVIVKQVSNETMNMIKIEVKTRLINDSVVLSYATYLHRSVVSHKFENYQTGAHNANKSFILILH